MLTINNANVATTSNYNNFVNNKASGDAKKPAYKLVFFVLLSINYIYNIC